MGSAASSAAPMALLDEKFKAPPQNDTAQWDIVALLVSHGFRYQTLLDPLTDTPVPYPRAKCDAEKFIQKDRK